MRLACDPLGAEGAEVSEPLLPFEDGDDRTMRDSWLAYHLANPHVYAGLCRYADEAIRSGRGHLGISMLFERLRWYTTIETRGDGLKLNNNYRAFYARLWLQDHPEHPEFFETRVQRYAGAES